MIGVCDAAVVGTSGQSPHVSPNILPYDSAPKDSTPTGMPLGGMDPVFGIASTIHRMEAAETVRGIDGITKPLRRLGD